MIVRKDRGIAYWAGTWPLNPHRPSVVFIHGSGLEKALWHYQIDALAPQLNTLALDLPGHGESDAPALARVEDYAAGVMRWIDTLKLPQPIPCGLSLGGAIVLQMLLDHPYALAGGILIGTGARLRVHPAIFEAIANDYHGFANGAAFHGASPQTDPEQLKPVKALAAVCPPAVCRLDFHACDRFDVMGRLGEIKLPVLIVNGADDPLTPPKYSDYLEQHIANAHHVRVSDAGHMVPVEQPEAVNTGIAAFVGDTVPSGP
jgi:pimeloyl-ACP methyl ester carboxylesterase